ncbi:TetR/AcrR family transcriptional regulator C-terminal domain-containing protein [Actinomadura scrupuli]|uniref:TetR/AcrR family transcriptional regulator C-terminal domain-containing protein n=1 Tax=Actinomadura scrupuli TaxID=559629 RepID=UPI003D95F676
MIKKSADGDMPTLPWRKAPKPAPPKQPLGQDLIVETAIRVLDAEGLDGVSMRRIAQELGTGPASLYAHISNKDELLELMLERIAGEIRLPEELDPSRWQEQMKEIARESQRVWTSHADIAKISLVSIPTGPNQLRIAEAMLTLMLGGGVPGQVAAWALDRLGMYIDADAIEASMYTAKLKQGFDLASYFAGIDDYFRKLPPQRFPLISSMVDVLTAGDGNERFEFGLDVFVRGLASYVEE